MSKFRELVENLLKEDEYYDYYDHDDDKTYTTKADWAAWNKSQRDKVAIKDIKPITKEDLVYIKAITIPQFDSYESIETYLTNNKKFPYTYYKEKAFKFPVSQAESFIEEHPKYTTSDVIGRKYERHFELEKC